MKKLTWGIILVAILAGIFIFKAHNTQNQVTTIGVITGMTGQYAFVGQNYVKGVTIAEEVWNKVC